MSRNSMWIRTLRWAPIALCLGLGVQLAAAQQLSEITVTARLRASVQEVGRAHATNAPIEVTTITRRVSYGDLNLTTNSGRALLERRVRQAAQGECMELDRLHPRAHSQISLCTHNVVTHAMPQMHAAIAAATHSTPGN